MAQVKMKMRYCGLVIDDSVLGENLQESYSFLAEAEAKSRESRFINGEIQFHPTEYSKRTFDDMVKVNNMYFNKKLDDILYKEFLKILCKKDNENEND